MNQYLPSKKFILTFFSIILALGIVYTTSFLIKSKTVNIELTTEKKVVTMQEFMVVDSDNDGLKDWEEALWKTNPKMTDTDNDGTSDGEEIKLNRNPLVANTAKTGNIPSDQADMDLIAANKKKDEEFAKLSETDKLSRTLFSQYLASKSASGEALSQINKQIILDTAVSMTQNESNTPKYSALDIKIINNSPTTTKEYGNTLSKAFYTGTSQENVYRETDTINLAIQTQNEKVLDNLDPIIESYDKGIAKILLVSVPQDAVNMHLKFLNDLSDQKTSLEEIKLLFSDPVKAIVGIDRYQSSILGLKKDLVELKSYFIKKNISYQSNEYGYVWLNII